MIFSWKQFEAYGDKKLPITKIDLQLICDRVGLDFDSTKYLTSGSFGNAYKCGDKVLKITSDKREANDVLKCIKSPIPGIVKYYSISRYRKRGGEYYVIIMDYALPIIDYIKGVKKVTEHGFHEFLQATMDVLTYNWEKKPTLDEYHDLIEQEGWAVNAIPMSRDLADRMYYLYKRISKRLKDNPDFHPWNVGVMPNGELVLFDFNTFTRFTRFDKSPYLN